MMIAHRIRQARLAAGLSLAVLSDKVGVSHATIQQYEKGQLTPSSSQLLKLARSCGVRIEYFFRTQMIDLLQPEFRKPASPSSFNNAKQEALKLRVLALVEKRVELLSAFSDSPILAFAPPNGLPDRIDSLDEIENFSDQIRNRWQLGMSPIIHLTDTLEALGLFIIEVHEEHPKFSGLTATARTGEGREFPVMAVSTFWLSEHKHFTLANELGRLLLKGRLAEGLDEEACDRFAGAFLAPQATVRYLLGQQRHALEWKELYALKHRFGLSMARCLERAKQCDVINDEVYSTLAKQFAANGWDNHTPCLTPQQERPQFFNLLTYRALAEQYISESKAAELLGIPMMRFHKARQP